MLKRVLQLVSRERDLRTVWAVEKGGRRSYLVGTAHFFPYHFRGSLSRHIRGAQTVLLEGPLDEEAMLKVVRSGSGEAGASLYDALDPRTISKINRALGVPSPALSAHQLYRGLFQDGPEDWLAEEIRGLRPWMAFFRVWTHYRRRNGWKYTMDLDASRIARGLGKEVRHLETIEEQIEALNGVPLERIVNFLKSADWGRYGGEYVRRYCRGDLGGVMAVARIFPTFCESIIDRRDPILHERMSPYFSRGTTVAFVGIVHCPGVIRLLRAEGYDVGSPSGN